MQDPRSLAITARAQAPRPAGLAPVCPGSTLRPSHPRARPGGGGVSCLWPALLSDMEKVLVSFCFKEEESAFLSGRLGHWVLSAVPREAHPLLSGSDGKSTVTMPAGQQCCAEGGSSFHFLSSCPLPHPCSAHTAQPPRQTSASCGTSCKTGTHLEETVGPQAQRGPLPSSLTYITSRLPSLEPLHSYSCPQAATWWLSSVWKTWSGCDPRFSCQRPFSRGDRWRLIKKAGSPLFTPLFNKQPLKNSCPASSFPTRPSPGRDAKRGRSTHALPETPGLVLGNIFTIEVFRELAIVSGTYLFLEITPPCTGGGPPQMVLLSFKPMLLQPSLFNWASLSSKQPRCPKHNYVSSIFLEMIYFKHLQFSL